MNIPLTPEGFIDHQLFNGIRKFLDNNQDHATRNRETPSTELRLEKGGRYFSVRCILFQDNSFEVGYHRYHAPSRTRPCVSR
ncbi:MAG: hypothetical protein R2758_11340 [Bacteroidales bacterium]